MWSRWNNSVHHLQNAPSSVTRWHFRATRWTWLVMCLWCFVLVGFQEKNVCKGVAPHHYCKEEPVINDNTTQHNVLGDNTDSSGTLFQQIENLQLIKQYCSISQCVWGLENLNHSQILIGFLGKQCEYNRFAFRYVAFLQQIFHPLKKPMRIHWHDDNRLSPARFSAGSCARVEILQWKSTRLGSKEFIDLTEMSMCLSTR